MGDPKIAGTDILIECGEVGGGGRASLVRGGRLGRLSAWGGSSPV